MKLAAIATIRTDYPDAHFWIIRRGSADQCGKPVKVFNPEHIGIRVERTDLLLPDYLFYALTNVHGSGYWKSVVTGTLSLVNIRVSDVRDIEMSPR